MNKNIKLSTILLLFIMLFTLSSCSLKEEIIIDEITKPSENEDVHKENEVVDTEITIPNIDKDTEVTDSSFNIKDDEPVVTDDIEITTPHVFDFANYRDKIKDIPEKLKLYNAFRTGLLNRDDKISIPIFDTQTISDIYEFVRMDNPQFFYAPTSFKVLTTKINGNVSAMEVEFVYNDKWTPDNINNARIKINEKSEEILKNTSVIDGDYNKIIYIYKYLTETIKYNDEDDDDYNIYGALINGKATCEGFAETFQYLLLLSDIDCMCVVGESREQPHEWNMAEIDGQWYFFDVTWDSPSNTSKYLPYNYFALTLDDISSSHNIYYSDCLPEANNTKYNYYYYNNLIVKEYSEVELVNMSKYSYKLNPNHITFRTINIEVLDTSIENIQNWLPKAFKDLGITENQISYMTNDELNIIDISINKEEEQ